MIFLNILIYKESKDEELFLKSWITRKMLLRIFVRIYSIFSMIKRHFFFVQCINISFVFRFENIFFFKCLENGSVLIGK